MAAAPTSAPALRTEPGLVVVSAVNDAVLGKDYESVSSVQSVDATGTRTTTEWAIPDPQAPDGVRKQRAQSVQRAEDTQKSHRLILWYLPGDPETLPGSTGPMPSVELFDEIARTGQAQVVVGAVSQSDGGALGGFMAARKYFRGTVKKVGTEPLRVLVNGVPTLLNTVHVAGTVAVANDRGDVEFWWVDDPAARFALKFSFQGSIARIVRINFAGTSESGPGAPKSLELGLGGKSCRSEIPGIYFLTDSAQLLQASQPAIAGIAATLKAHPDWVVTIEGHTDSTGSDEHNLDLSRRRAAALKEELISKYAIPAARLQTAGFGRTRPVDTNDTMDGRAHNRRVEISRRC
jgi:outer membrane protein OmpA-like peptidoglycan-associated protein